MKELVNRNKSGQAITSSLLVAEKFSKEHKNVLRDIENLECSEEFRRLNFELSSYESQQNKQLPMYLITKDGFSFLVMGYRGKQAGKFKEGFINAFNQMEKQLQETPQFYIPQTYREALLLGAELAEKLELQAPKVEYYDNVLQSTSLITTNNIAKELGISAIALNKKLNELKVIYKEGGSWFLFSKYQDKGYTGTKTFQHEDKTHIHLYWTEKGRQFIHSILN